MDLYEALDRVKDFPSFLTFAKLLQADREYAVTMEKEEPSSPYASQHGWENITIEDFLDGAIRWAEATRCGESQGTSAANPWKQFAEFLYCGKIYE
ncbi:MAG: hypothetical protein R2748_28755 [Bryobacterales bacterium]